ncbi:LacI family DNA-binding transcriptional regulator [Mycobacteroides abscessus]|uniref:LacI family DNA-binding transcriptional regulator n=1 Tax=Mycobacteroides abscessus TaxID=36809 RepID=UPI001A95DA9B|nr:LacI family DNA-binding transcriptional regulator [Mycobacteroides abscessus]
MTSRTTAEQDAGAGAGSLQATMRLPGESAIFGGGERGGAVKATSKEVASHAGVSRSTVSQVLNGHHQRFATSTVTRVRDAAEALGYRPSAAARTLARGTSDVVITLLPNITFGARLRDLIDALSSGLAARGFTNLLRISTAENSVDDAILELRPHAIISLGPISASDVDRLRRHGVLLILQTTAIQEHIDIAIGRRQAEHLHQCGYGTIAVAVPTDLREHTFAPPRTAGVHEWSLHNGQQLLPTLHVDLEGAGALEALRALPDVPIGIAAYNDEVALSVLSAAHMLHRPVPTSIGIIGVDNSRISHISAPPLTSIDFDLEFSAAKMLESISSETERIDIDDILEVESRLHVIHRGSTVQR